MFRKHTLYDRFHLLQGHAAHSRLFVPRHGEFFQGAIAFVTLR
ncbi:hypothetical protein [Roseimicrobium sp. ORNL1]|nr:hypothetical protein [Roseimicrobium sp. ORNL1]